MLFIISFGSSHCYSNNEYKNDNFSCVNVVNFRTHHHNTATFSLFKSDQKVLKKSAGFAQIYQPVTTYKRIKEPLCVLTLFCQLLVDNHLTCRPTACTCLAFRAWMNQRPQFLSPIWQFWQFSVYSSIAALFKTEVLNFKANHIRQKGHQLW